MAEEYSKLYLKDNYLNKGISILTGKTIIEYDLKSANTSLCSEYHLLPQDQIEKISALPRSKRVVKIGKLCRKNKEFNEGLKKAFVDIRRRFFEANNIQDEDILAIKKDAIFCLRKCRINEFGPCLFRPKNVYSSYLYLPPLELYYKGSYLPSKELLAVKGISDETLHLHEDYMLTFFKQLFRHIEEGKQHNIFRYLSDFTTAYKLKQLEPGYYREFNQNSLMIDEGGEVTYDDETFIPYEGSEKSAHLNIDYNFSKVIIPLLNILIY